MASNKQGTRAKIHTRKTNSFDEKTESCNESNLSFHSFSKLEVSISAAFRFWRKSLVNRSIRDFVAIKNPSEIGFLKLITKYTPNHVSIHDELPTVKSFNIELIPTLLSEPRWVKGVRAPLEPKSELLLISIDI